MDCSWHQYHNFIYGISSISGFSVFLFVVLFYINMPCHPIEQTDSERILAFPFHWTISNNTWVYCVSVWVVVHTDASVFLYIFKQEHYTILDNRWWSKTKTQILGQTANGNNLKSATLNSCGQIGVKYVCTRDSLRNNAWTPERHANLLWLSECVFVFIFKFPLSSVRASDLFRWKDSVIFSINV